MNTEEQIERSRKHKDLKVGDGTEAHAIGTFYSDISRFMFFYFGKFERKYENYIKLINFAA